MPSSFYAIWMEGDEWDKIKTKRIKPLHLLDELSNVLISMLYSLLGLIVLGLTTGKVIQTLRFSLFWVITHIL